MVVVFNFYDVKPKMGREHFNNRVFSLFMSSLLLSIRKGQEYLNTLITIETISILDVFLLVYINTFLSIFKQ